VTGALALSQVRVRAPTRVHGRRNLRRPSQSRPRIVFSTTSLWRGSGRGMNAVPQIDREVFPRRAANRGRPSGRPFCCFRLFQTCHHRVTLGAYADRAGCGSAHGHCVRSQAGVLFRRGAPVWLPGRPLGCWQGGVDTIETLLRRPAAKLGHSLRSGTVPKRARCADECERIGPRMSPNAAFK
jgi:hypothetical protein